MNSTEFSQPIPAHNNPSHVVIPFTLPKSGAIPLTRTAKSRLSQPAILLLMSLFFSSCWNSHVTGFQEENKSSASPQARAGFDFEQTKKILQNSCADCHAGGADEGEFEIDGLLSDSTSLSGQFEKWQIVRQRINDRSMPPADADPIQNDDRDATVQWIQQATVAALSKIPPKAGPPLLRRLSRHEYSNTIRDLLNVHFDAGQGLPEDTAGGEGFVNAAETLIISPIHAEKYLEAATRALEYAARNQATRKRLLVKIPPKASEQMSSEEFSAEEEAARFNLKLLANRAFRRPVTSKEIERFVELFRVAREDRLSFEDAVFYAMRGVLISPSFLFIAEKKPEQSGKTELLTDHELATRLSYFLWASMPDRELLQLANKGQLNNDTQLRKQTLRMLKSRGTHLRDSMEHFVGGWLGTADIGRSKKVDREKHRSIRDPHVAALRNQPIYFLESVLQSNDSLLDLIDSDWTFLNNELMRVYRLSRRKIQGDFVQRLKRVKLSDEYLNRGGLLGMGGVYVISSYPRRSSPVLRGAWVLEKLLGVELPPPPPDVPELSTDNETEQSLTLRQRLERHRSDASCSSCHNRIDPLGFAMENFDEIGRWRTKEGNARIDSVAKLAGGREIDGVAGLKKYLLNEKDAFVRNLTRKMLGYALGRSLQPSDISTVERIVQQLKQNNYRAQDLVLGIVMSEPFRKKVVDEGEAEKRKP